jgi:ribosome recycling factor
MIAESKKKCQDKMEKSLQGLINELKKIRTGRAQVSMLDNV